MHDGATSTCQTCRGNGISRRAPGDISSTKNQKVHLETWLLQDNNPRDERIRQVTMNDTTNAWWSSIHWTSSGNGSNRRIHGEISTKNQKSCIWKHGCYKTITREMVGSPSDEAYNTCMMELIQPLWTSRGNGSSRREFGDISSRKKIRNGAFESMVAAEQLYNVTR